MRHYEPQSSEESINASPLNDVKATNSVILSGSEESPNKTKNNGAECITLHSKNFVGIAPKEYLHCRHGNTDLLVFLKERGTKKSLYKFIYNKITLFGIQKYTHA
ncbi:MAG TPA: hypothetical protein DEO94_04190 [Cyanobacteria bacterium UBA11991]|nr:hypothetical protein [Cyanobacteria bacterium UBA11991]